jgi:predicted RND superfamily exporter protein
MTTLLVFGTLILTPSPGLFSLGITLLIALVWTLVSSLVILPSILFVVQSHTHSPIPKT